MLWRKNRVASKAASPQQEQPDHSIAALHLVFGVFIPLIIYCFNFLNHSLFFTFPVITWSSKDSLSSMSFFSLSGREKGEFSADWSIGAWGSASETRDWPVQVIDYWRGELGHVPQDTRPRQGWEGAAARAVMAFSQNMLVPAVAAASCMQRG